MRGMQLIVRCTCMVFCVAGGFALGSRAWETEGFWSLASAAMGIAGCFAADLNLHGCLVAGKLEGLKEAVLRSVADGTISASDGHALVVELNKGLEGTKGD